MSYVNDAYPHYSPKAYPMNHCLSSHYENTMHVWISVLLKDTSAVANTESWSQFSLLLLLSAPLCCLNMNNITDYQEGDTQWWDNKWNKYSFAPLVLLFNRELQVLLSDGFWLTVCRSGEVFCVWERCQETRPRHEHDESHTHLIAVLHFSGSHQLNKLSHDWLAIILLKQKPAFSFHMSASSKKVFSMIFVCIMLRGEANTL